MGQSKEGWSKAEKSQIREDFTKIKKRKISIHEISIFVINTYVLICYKITFFLYSSGIEELSEMIG